MVSSDSTSGLDALPHLIAVIAGEMLIYDYMGEHNSLDITHGGMRFNAAKCHGTATLNFSTTHWQDKYWRTSWTLSTFGVTLSNDLEWSKHIATRDKQG